MSQAIRLSTEKRAAIGKNAVKQLRKKGLVPGVIYGHGQAPAAIAVAEKALSDALKHHAHFMELDCEGKIETALLQDLQYDVFGQHVVHADFLRVDIDEPVDVVIGVEFVGHPKGASAGGILQRIMDEIKVRCAPRVIPDVITVDVSALDVHQQLLMKDLKLPEGVKLMEDADKAICAIVTQKVVEAAPAAAAEGAVPEVIKKEEKKPETEA
jgi:large subunit ribosomal protein L25